MHPGLDACPDAAFVYGIPHNKLLSGVVSWRFLGRLDAFLRDASFSVPESDSDSDDDHVSDAAMKQDLDIMPVVHKWCEV